MKPLAVFPFLKDDISVEKVAELSGFENTSYFIQLFKKIVGTTPKKYKEALNIK